MKRKAREIYAPADGQIVAIESVEDDVFSQKMVGDGVALIPMSNTFVAPIDGVVSKIFSTNHAYSIKSKKDLEVMVHIGIDSVKLAGKGFTRLANEGDKVKAGDAIIETDLTYICKHVKNIITPIVVSDESDVKQIDKHMHIVKCQDIIMEVR